MAKYVLDNFIEEEEQHYLAISSHVPDYKLCWSINRNLSINLVKQKNHEIKSSKFTTNSFALFSFNSDLGELWLVSNKGNRGLLLPKQKGVDFILVGESEELVNLVSSTINKLPEVLISFKLTVKSAKDKMLFVF